MSLLNAWVTKHEVIVAVDTVCAGGTVASKISPIPHLNAVLAMRGQSAFHTLLHMKCLNAGLCTFDDMNDRMLELLQAVEPWMSQDLLVPGCDLAEVVIAGWSHRRKSMEGWSFEKRGGATEFAQCEIVRHISPFDASMSALSLKSGAVEKLAAAQVQFMRKLSPGSHCGGDLIVCRLTQTSTTTTHRTKFQEQEMAA